MNKKILISSLIVGIIILMIISYPIMRLALTDCKVSKSLLTDTYYVKIKSDEGEYAVFTEYMEGMGWVENLGKQMGAGHYFEKNGDTKHISNRDIKTAIIDGRFNFYFIGRWKI